MRNYLYHWFNVLLFQFFGLLGNQICCILTGIVSRIDIVMNGYNWFILPFGSLGFDIDPIVGYVIIVMLMKPFLVGVIINGDKVFFRRFFASLWHLHQRLLMRMIRFLNFFFTFPAAVGG